MDTEQTVGLVGLGLVGKALAARLLQAGYAVLGCDIDEQAREAAASFGVRIADGPASLAGKAGMDARQVLDILRNSAAYSKAMDTKGDKMVGGDFEPAARLAQHAKDVGLILELAEEVGARVSVSELHAGVLDEAIEAGLGALDNSAVIEVFRRHRT